MKSNIQYFYHAIDCFMKALIQRTIELLKKRVKDNLEIINKNQAKINEMINQPPSAERTYHIEKNYTLNKSLLTENNDYISLQLSLLNFLEKYKNTLTLGGEEELEDLNPASLLDEDELFEMTVQGKLNFDFGHPRFNDELFFNKLLSYFAAIEAYEKCNALLSLKKKDQVG
jgi:hypothetical protein